MSVQGLLCRLYTPVKMPICWKKPASAQQNMCVSCRSFAVPSNSQQKPWHEMTLAAYVFTHKLLPMCFRDFLVTAVGDNCLCVSILCTSCVCTHTFEVPPIFIFVFHFSFCKPVLNDSNCWTAVANAVDCLSTTTCNCLSCAGHQNWS